jgi:NAD(P)H-flavin reductase
MGPTGMETEIVANKKVVLIGGGFGNAVLIAIGRALKANNCKIIYFAGYKKSADIFYRHRIEEFADQIVWACEEGKIGPNRKQDIFVKGNVLDAIESAKEYGLINNTEHIICIGSDRMMHAVSNYKSKIFGEVKMICRINSPMQCMMKGVCGQCIQKVNDKRNYIFSCACQDQNSEIVDFTSLGRRLQQNSLFEKINKLQGYLNDR